MTRIVLLDSAPLGMAVHPRPTPEFLRWWAALQAGSTAVGIPEIAVYELRRELVRLNRTESLRQLEVLRENFRFFPITTPIIYRASELWAEARRFGRPTASPESLDGDVILAATAQLQQESGDDVIVATTNLSHLAPLVPAAYWHEVGA